MKIANKKAARAQLAPVGLLIALAIVFVVMLVVLFPTSEQYQKWASRETPSAVSVAMLEKMVGASPDDVVLRLELARQLRVLGRLASARQTLFPLLDVQNEQGRRARLIDLECLVQLALASAPGSKSRDEYEAVVLARLVVVAREPLDIDEQARLGAWAEMFSAIRIAKDIYRRMASQSRAADWYRKAAEMAIASGSFEEASDLLLRSSHVAAKPEEARNDRRAAASALLQGDLGRRAHELVLNLLEAQPNDRALLQDALRISMAIHDLASAQRLVDHLAKLEPENTKVLFRQLEISLAMRDLRAAVEVGQKILQHGPHPSFVHERLAQSFEWGGRPDLALARWEWLIANRGHDKEVEEAFRLAQGMWDTDRFLGLAIQRSERRRTDSDALFVAQLLEQTGDPERAARFLSKACRDRASSALLLALAQLRLRMGNIDETITAYEKLAGARPLKRGESFELASLYVRRDRSVDALRVLEAAQKQHDAEDPQLLRFFADIAFEAEAHAAAKAAYRQLMDADAEARDPVISEDPTIAERLSWLHENDGEIDRAIDAAVVGYRRNRGPRLLLYALSTALRAGRIEAVEHLLLEGLEERAWLREHPELWIFAAHLHIHRGRRLEARRAYEAAIAALPENIPAKAGLLWILIEDRDQNVLAHHLRAWQSQAEASNDLAGVFASGYAALGRHEEALRFYAHAVRRTPYDAHLLLAYAESLEGADRETEAWRLRRHVLREMRQRDQAGLLRDPRDFLAYVAVSQRVGSPLDQRHAAARLERSGASPNMTLSWRERLALAISHHDLERVAEIYREHERNFSLPDRVSLLRLLGEEGQAIDLAAFALGSTLPDDDRNQLLEQLDALVKEQPNYVEALGALESLDGAMIRELSARTTLSFPNLDLTLKLGLDHQRFERADLTALQGFRMHSSLSWNLKTRRLNLAVGASMFDGLWAPFAELRLEQFWGRDLMIEARVTLGSPLTETMYLRANGARDLAEVGARWQFTPRSYFRSAVALLQDRLTTGERLGVGGRLDGELGFLVRHTGPRWSLFARESVLLRDQSDPILDRPTPTIVTVRDGTLISSGTAFAGIGSAIEMGDSSGAPGLSARRCYRLEVVTGWLAPANLLGVEVRGGLGTSLFGGDLLSLTGHVSNTLDGSEGRLVVGASASYAVRLWL